MGLSTFGALSDQVIAYRDADIIVADKPAGVPSQSAVIGGTDDLVSRLRAYFRGHGEHDYLGVHQRLDRATSGLLAYTRNKAANKGLAAQIESRQLHKEYLACVPRWTFGKRTLEHMLVEGDGGTMIAQPAGSRAGVRAVTHVEPVRRVGARSLLRLVLETGRTHQARVQLAAVGSPIAGDRLYGAGDPQAAAPRLMLHSVRIAFDHPMSGQRIDVTAPAPEAFDRWLEHGDRSPFAPEKNVAPEGGLDLAAFDDLLRLAEEERFLLESARADLVGGTTAFRILHEGGDGVPGLALDRYGDFGLVHVYDDAVRKVLPQILKALERLGFRGIYVVDRPKQANTLGEAGVRIRASALPTVGEAAPNPLPILERGVPYLARLGDGMSTGIFLDQRDNRARLRELAAGKSVLNLFAYTGAFTVAAALGGARESTSVDASQGALTRAAEGLMHANLKGAHRFVVDDVFAWIAREKKRARFDIVILDPPSYSTVGASRFSTASDYRALAASVMPLVASGGMLLACTNHRQTVQAKFRRWLHEAARDAQRTIASMRDLGSPTDFPAPFGLQSHLKSTIVRFS